MTLPSSSSDATVSYSFVTKKDKRESIELMKTKVDSEEDQIEFKILKGSLTANNKFYLGFGDNKIFNFFKCYPIDSERSSLVSLPVDSDSLENDFAHPCVWGIAQVTKSQVENVQVGTKFRALLPIGELVSFRSAWVDSKDETKLIVDRPSTNPAYNIFTKLSDPNEGEDGQYDDIALACFPGIIAGFGLNHNLRNNNFYGAEVVVVTSASSKVALALATYLKYSGKNDKLPKVTKKVIGYTSESNKEFCRKTGLYDEILGYEETLSTTTNVITKYIMVDIAGRGQVYKQNMHQPNVKIVKLLGVGNSTSTPDSESTFAFFPLKAKIKMALTMMNIFPWLSSWLNPVEELYLVFKDLADLESEVGIEKLQVIMKEYERLFCEAASNPGKGWMTVRNCDTEDSIQAAFRNIVKGTVPPSETIVLDIVKAVAHRK